jgi:hypothetical protein
MKLNHAIILLTISFLCCTTSCNNTEQNKTNPKNPGGIDTSKTPHMVNESDCNYYIDQKEADDMIKDFLKRYKKKGTAQEVRGLNTEFWIDSCTITTLRNFFDTANDNYDGIRIFQTGKLSSEILLVPTSEITPPSTNYQHFNRFEPEVIFRADCNSSNINLGDSKANELIDDFGEKFRKESQRGDRRSSTHDSLSIGFWFAKCKIKLMANLLEDHKYDVNGMIAYSGSYLKKQSNAADIRQKYDRQSTLILVPGKKSGSVYTPNWHAVEPPAPIIERVRNGGYNHSQLCPQICN